MIENLENDMIPYPWKEFLSKINSFYLFGYGSLINEYSYSVDMKTSNGLIPVMGFGIKRILNYDPDEKVRSRPLYQDPLRGEEYFAAFNVEYTQDVKDKANGVLRKIEKSDFESFVSRERGYSLVKIICESFGKENPKTYEAYTLCAPEYFQGRKLVNNQLLPNVPYYKICKQGAAEVSDDFLEVWLDTSFLGDGRNVREWEKDEENI